MNPEEWETSFARSLGMMILGEASEEEPDDDFLLFFNAHHGGLTYTIPSRPRQVRWEVVIDTGRPSREGRRRLHRPGTRYALRSRSLAVLRGPRRQR